MTQRRHLVCLLPSLPHGPRKKPLPTTFVFPILLISGPAIRLTSKPHLFSPQNHLDASHFIRPRFTLSFPSPFSMPVDMLQILSFSFLRPPESFFVVSSFWIPRMYACCFCSHCATVRKIWENFSVSSREDPSVYPFINMLITGVGTQNFRCLWCQNWNFFSAWTSFNLTCSRTKIAPYCGVTKKYVLLCRSNGLSKANVK